MVDFVEKNIFEAAAKQAKKANPPTPKKETPSPKVLDPALLKEILFKKYGSEDPEVMQMFVRMREMKHDLEKQLDEVRKKGEEFQFDVDTYIEKELKLHPDELENNIKKQKIF